MYACHQIAIPVEDIGALHAKEARANLPVVVVVGASVVVVVSAAM